MLLPNAHVQLLELYSMPVLEVFELERLGCERCYTKGSRECTWHERSCRRPAESSSAQSTNERNTPVNTRKFVEHGGTCCPSYLRPLLPDSHK